jgi:hypothetical protein
LKEVTAWKDREQMICNILSKILGIEGFIKKLQVFSHTKLIGGSTILEEISSIFFKRILKS